MLRLIIVALIALVPGPAFAQAPAAQTPAALAATTDIHAPAPIFREVVVSRTTPAISYRPRSGQTKVDLAGTSLLPGARGVAGVSGNQSHFEIDVRVEQMKPATGFGDEYLTYVLWAITPEGRPKNLGELQLRDGATRLEVMTDLQTFALIVTAEPYFAVSQPSDIVVLENVVGHEGNGALDTADARYDLLKRGSYLLNQAGMFPVPPLEPGAPLDLAEARNAVALARIAGADRYAADTFSRAAHLLENAELAHKSRKRGHEVMMPARQAAQAAEDARLLAVERREEEFITREFTELAERQREALQRAQAAEERRQRAEAAETSTRQVLLAAQSEAERARAQAESAQRAAEADARDARLQALRAQAQVAVAEQEKNTLREKLREQLDMFLETRETARGLIMMVPDVLFNTGRATLTATAREKLARVSGILAAHSDLHISAEGHTDNVGADAANQRLSEQRAAAVLEYLVQQKLPPTAIDTAGFGETRPVASNATSEGRQQNRRVELVVTGESIGSP
jgi:outer membrane protein OmpA-like peptidoglycan-associated protein